MTFPVLPANGPSGYNLTNSLRIRSSASAYLNRTLTSNTNRRISTTSMWFKLGSSTGSSQTLLSAAANGSSSIDLVGFTAANEFQVLLNGGATGVRTTQVFRDPSAWYHLVFSIDTAQATASNRIKVYVNGVQVTALSIAAYPAQNYDPNINSAIIHNFARQTNAANYFDGYMDEVNFIDGQALTPSSFGSTNAVTGVWQPARYTGTYGTNGFYLPFTNTTSTTTLGNDFSGNGNNWTTNNISLTPGATYDAMTDVPTLTSPTAANFAVMNPLWQGRTNAPTNGNLDYPASSIGIGTMDVSQFSSYWEITSTGGTTTASVYSTSAATTVGVTTGLTYGFRFNSSTGALDYTTNGSSFTSLATSLTSGPYFVYVSTAASTTASFNGGQRPFSYTPPSGFVALNTFNLPASTVPNGASFMAATLYTGTGASLTVANTVGSASFQPDFVWAKGRSGATDHALYDSVRGVQKQIESNNTGAETTETTGLTAFGSTGFTVGALAQMNTSSATYVAWQWKANGTAVTNTAGSITSTVSANTTSGFSVVTYTGTAIAGTIGHGLGVAPQLIIVKPRTGTVTTDAWNVYHVSTGNTNFLVLNATDASAAASNRWNNTSPTSSVFSIGTVPSSVSVGYVAYCFAPIAGFSAFGSYTGNGSTDGPFIYTGFRPRWVLVKSSSTTGNWQLLDTSRSTYNVSNANLYPNLSNAEVNGGNEDMDILSNGFKPRNASASFNVSGTTYIYAAFAENPFKNALAR